MSPTERLYGSAVSLVALFAATRALAFLLSAHPLPHLPAISPALRAGADFVVRAHHVPPTGTDIR